MRVIVIGGAGYIGSHTCLELLRRGHKVQVIDNFCNSSQVAIQRVRDISKCDLKSSNCDIRDAGNLESVFFRFRPNAVIHFGGLKAVGESSLIPLAYYDVNVGGTITLLKVMDAVNCKNIIFSSSATVYGKPQYLPCDESHPLNPTNPYGRTKLIGEQILKDWASIDTFKRAVALRYFNPVGADVSGLIGENPMGDPNNLMPLIAKVAMGQKDYLRVYGNDLKTIDGTGVRDYIHVVDLAKAHVAALEKINILSNFEVINVGRGIGVSVLQLIDEFERQSGKRVIFKFAPRRVGDADEVWADTSKAASKLGFEAQLSVKEMCMDTWRWKSLNPNGYSE